MFEEAIIDQEFIFGIVIKCVGSYIIITNTENLR